MAQTPAQKRAHWRTYEYKHRKRINANARRRYAKNPERKLARGRKCRKAHPERYRIRDRKKYRKHRSRTLAVLRAREERNRRWLYDIYKIRGCVDCGLKTSYEQSNVLHFDHIDPWSKSFDMARGLTCSRKTLTTEAKKCRIRCKWCHMRNGARRPYGKGWAGARTERRRVA